MSGDNELEVLRNSNAMGRWSFAFKAPVGSTITGQVVSLLTVQALEAWTARPWQISLNAWAYADGNVGGPVANFPPQNFLYSLSNLYVQLEFGVDGANETVSVDWPPGGCTLQINSAFIRLGVFWMFDFLQAAPLLKGFLSPGLRLNPLTCSPRLTDVLSLPSNATTRVRRPARAVAYRISWALAIPGQSYTVVQEAAAGGGGATNSRQDGTHSMDVTFALNPDLVLDATAGWVPLALRTQQLAITVSVTGGNTFNIEWLLDLG